MRMLAAAAVPSLGLLVLLAASPGCDDSGGGGRPDVFDGHWELMALQPGGGEYGPADFYHIIAGTSTVTIGDLTLAATSSSFGGWGYGDPTDGTYVTGTWDGSRIVTVTDDYFANVVVCSTTLYLKETSLPTDGVLSGTAVGSPFSYAPTFGVHYLDHELLTIHCREPGSTAQVAIEAQITAPGIYTVGSEITNLDARLDGLVSYATSGTLTVTAISSSRFACDFDLEIAWSGAYVGSVDIPIVTGASPTADSHEGDDDSTTATPITVDGASQDHTFHTPTDEDWIKLTITDTVATHWIETTDLGGTTDTVLTLYDDTPTILTDNDDIVAGYSSQIAYTFPSTGTYYVKVTGWGDLGHYTVGVRTTP